MTEELDREREFHDAWANSVDPREVDVHGSWEPLATPETYWIATTLGDLTGLDVLELGSGLGEGATYLALQGAKVYATDLSPEMLKVAASVASAHGVEVKTRTASATDLRDFADSSFDVVYAANLLHHVDVAKCVDEIFRVLKPGGRMATWDPIQYNPVINVYRRMATSVRTEDEHPIRVQDLNLIKSKFASTQIRFFWLSSLVIFFRFFLIDRISPNAGRYWKLIIERRHKHRRLLLLTHAIDKVILRVIPPAKWLCWNVAIVAKKGD